MAFLEHTEFTARSLALNIEGLSPDGLFIGQGNQGLEVAALTLATTPTVGILQRAYQERRTGRAAPVLIVVLHPEGASLCGTGGDQPPIFNCTDTNQAERLCESALKLPDRNAAIRFLADAMPSPETPLPGIANDGLLSLHELTHGTRSRSDWAEASERGQQVLGKSSHDLINALGFNSEPLDNLTELLSAGEERTALAVLLNEEEVPEIGAGRINNVSPISYALTKADKEHLPWVVMVQGDRVRLYNTKNIGVGRRGRTETFAECQSSLMSSADIGLLWLHFSSDALKDNGTINSILEGSKRFAADIADKLRDRIYDIVVPNLAMGISNARNLTKPSKDEIALSYEMALTVLFRLLFIAYAEDRDLLPYKGNEAYRKRSLKQKAIELAKAASKQTPFTQGDHHWPETAQLWRAVYRGNRGWDVPAHDGTQIHEFLDEGRNITCPAIFHMGESDDRAPEDLSQMAGEACVGIPNIHIHVYATGHAFAHTGRPDYYSETASREAHARTFELFSALRS